MSHPSVHNTPSHPRSAAGTAARAQASSASHSASGASPAGLFALLLRGQQGEADGPVAAPPPSDTPTDEAPSEERAEAPQTRDDATPPAPEAAPPVPAFTPTVRSAAVAEPAMDEGAATDPLQRLGGTGRARPAHAAEALERARLDTDTAQATETAERATMAPDTPAAAATDGSTDTMLLRPADEPLPEPATATAPGTLPSLGHAADTSAPAPTPAPADAAPTARAHLPQPPTSPAFAPALGLQISTWLREGVQHAALELNPAELGPIDVRIALRDGQAQVALAADVPFTRQALADALPQLAEALGDVGVQLAGGDVSDQAGRRARDEAAAGPRGGAGALPGGAEPASAPAPAAARRRGLLDLYA